MIIVAHSAGPLPQFCLGGPGYAPALYARHRHGSCPNNEWGIGSEELFKIPRIAWMRREATAKRAIIFPDLLPRHITTIPGKNKPDHLTLGALFRGCWASATFRKNSFLIPGK